MRIQTHIFAAILLMVGLMLAGGPAAADNTVVIQHPDDTAGYLHKTCEGNPEDAIFCLGYIRGAINAMDGDTESGKEAPVYCMAPQITLNDIKTVFVRYCDNHPKDMTFRASSVLAVALAHEYPCPAVDGAQTGQ